MILRSRNGQFASGGNLADELREVEAAIAATERAGEPLASRHAQLEGELDDAEKFFKAHGLHPVGVAPIETAVSKSMQRPGSLVRRRREGDLHQLPCTVAAALLPGHARQRVIDRRGEPRSGTRLHKGRPPAIRAATRPTLRLFSDLGGLRVVSHTYVADG